jgi:hypothetical protein
MLADSDPERWLKGENESSKFVYLSILNIFMRAPTFSGQDLPGIHSAEKFEHIE